MLGLRVFFLHNVIVSYNVSSCVGYVLSSVCVFVLGVDMLSSCNGSVSLCVFM